MARTAGSPAWAKSGGMAGRDGEFSPSRDDEENDERQFCTQVVMKRWISCKKKNPKKTVLIRTPHLRKEYERNSRFTCSNF
jgi:hypothetical protein